MSVFYHVSTCRSKIIKFVLPIIADASEFDIFGFVENMNWVTLIRDYSGNLAVCYLYAMLHVGLLLCDYLSIVSYHI